VLLASNNLTAEQTAQYLHTPKSKRLLIAVSGIPGSGTALHTTFALHSGPLSQILTISSAGKTTLASVLVRRLNDKYRESSPGCSQGNAIAGFVPLDGYHLSRQQLDQLPDPTEAHFRRGAAFTFDGDSFLKFVKGLRKPLAPETRTLHAPSFDHAVKDPVQEDIPVGPRMRIVVFEGNYLSLNRSPWKEAAELMDELWFVEVEERTAIERLSRRHVKAGITRTLEEGRERAVKNDLVNGKDILQNKLKVQESIVSREDDEWKPENQEFEEGMG